MKGLSSIGPSSPMRTVPPRLTARPATTALGPNAQHIPGASGSWPSPPPKPPAGLGALNMRTSGWVFHEPACFSGISIASARSPKVLPTRAARRPAW